MKNNNYSESNNYIESEYGENYYSINNDCNRHIEEQNGYIKHKTLLCDNDTDIIDSI